MEAADGVKRNVTIDWTIRENVRAQLRVYVKRILSPRNPTFPAWLEMGPDALQSAAARLVHHTGSAQGVVQDHGVDV
ncbi:MAG: DUF3387 domain-containing protein, partial [Acidobacteria bacterium]|nr:DUF3387 domain-containing protein [Acidobacteriota bacterium]